MTRVVRRPLAIFVSACLMAINAPEVLGQNEPPPVQVTPQALAETPEQLQQLVAPIALYPDTLIAQILAASTYPEQIVEAAQWMDKNKGLSGKKLADEVNKQKWESAVKALVQFPPVLQNMSQNLAWTSQLGDAYINQPQDVNNAIQTMRQKAQAAGNLKSTPQITVTNPGQSIVIQPAQPDVVYVPQYDPWLVYGAPIPVWPGWYPYAGLYLGGPGLAFGLGFGVGLFAGFGWGWGHWGYDWHGGGRVVYNHNTFVSHSRTIVNRGAFDRGGFHNAGGHEQASHLDSHEQFGHQSFARAGEGTHSGAFSGFDHGGFSHMNSFRGSSSFGGFHAGGFHGGGFGGGHGGGGHR
jgi:hypothetical protein